MGSRQFEHPAGHAAAGTRDYLSLVTHFKTLWEQGVQAGHIPRVPAQRARKQATARLAESMTSTTSTSGAAGFSGLTASSSSSTPNAFGFAGRETALVTRPPNPTPNTTLTVLADAGFDVPRGLQTTTDWERVLSIMGEEDFAAAALQGVCDQCLIETAYDADDHSRRQLVGSYRASVCGLRSHGSERQPHVAGSEDKGGARLDVRS